MQPWLAFVADRALNYAATMLLFGGGVFVTFLAPAALAAELRRRFGHWEKMAAIVAGVSTVAWLPLQSAIIGESWGDAVSPLVVELATETTFGRVWGLRVLIAASLVGLVAFHAQAATFSSTLLSGALLASLALLGHAVMHAGVLGLAHRANHALHLLSAGLWVGCLLPLMASVTYLDNATLSKAAVTALRRFSSAAAIAVVIVVITGLCNTALVLGTWPLSLGSAYQACLAVKTGMVSAMIGLAIFNRACLSPRASAGDRRSIRRLRATIMIDVVLAAGILILVAGFGMFDPH
jgi:copper resistance protein D